MSILKELFTQPMASSEFRWRFVCAVTEENVQEAMKMLKVFSSPDKIAAIRARGGMWADYEGDVVMEEWTRLKITGEQFTINTDQYLKLGINNVLARMISGRC
jgi:hypothetical protein